MRIIFFATITNVVMSYIILNIKNSVFGCLYSIMPIRLVLIKLLVYGIHTHTTHTYIYIGIGVWNNIKDYFQSLNLY